MTNKEILKLAWKKSGKLFTKTYFSLLLATLITSACNSVLSNLNGIQYKYKIPVALGETVRTIDLKLSLALGTILFGGFILYGSCVFFLDFLRNEKVEYGNIFSGFRSFKDIFKLGLLHQIYIRLWTLLFIIPGIVKNYSYSMCYYIKKDKPELSAKECITESRRVMKGNKLQLFLIDFCIEIFPMLLALFSFGLMIGGLESTGYVLEQEMDYYVPFMAAGVLLLGLGLFIFAAIMLFLAGPLCLTARAVFYEKKFSQEFCRPEDEKAAANAESSSFADGIVDADASTSEEKEKSETAQENALRDAQENIPHNTEENEEK